MSNTPSLVDLLEKLRPLIISYYQDIEVENYKTEYRIRNGGRLPSNDEIDTFVGILIERGIPKNKADEVIRAYIRKYQRPSLAYLVTKTLFYIPSTIIYLLYLVLYLKSRGYDLAGDTLIFHPAAIVSSVLLILYSISIYAHVIYSEYKDW
ncbi:MAG: hypothetical protein ACP5OU_05300 [Methanothrix sp.]